MKHKEPQMHYAYECYSLFKQRKGTLPRSIASVLLDNYFPWQSLLCGQQMHQYKIPTISIKQTPRAASDSTSSFAPGPYRVSQAVYRENKSHGALTRSWRQKRPPFSRYKATPIRSHLLCPCPPAFSLMSLYASSPHGGATNEICCILGAGFCMRCVWGACRARGGSADDNSNRPETAETNKVTELRPDTRYITPNCDCGNIILSHLNYVVVGGGGGVFKGGVG